MFTAVLILSSCRSLGIKYALFFLLAVTWTLCHFVIEPSKRSKATARDNALLRATTVPNRQKYRHLSLLGDAE